jgi:O-antigen/teichoic acid export membrane protein
LILGFIGVGIIILVVLSAFIFWFAMIIDCCKRKFNKGFERIIWLLVLICTNLLGTTIYYFLIKKYNPDGLLDTGGHLR